MSPCHFFFMASPSLPPWMDSIRARNRAQSELGMLRYTKIHLSPDNKYAVLSPSHKAWLSLSLKWDLSLGYTFESIELQTHWCLSCTHRNSDLVDLECSFVIESIQISLDDSNVQTLVSCPSEAPQSSPQGLLSCHPSISLDTPSHSFSKNWM